MVRKTKKYKKTKKNVKKNNGYVNGNGSGNKRNSRQKKFKKNSKKMMGGAHQTVEFDDKIKAPPNCNELQPIPIDKNRYIDKQQYYNNSGNFCYAITTIQLLRNIINLDDYIDQLNKISAPLALQKLPDVVPTTSKKINFCYTSKKTNTFAISDAKKNKIIYENLLKILESNDKNIKSELTEIANLIFPINKKQNPFGQQDVSEFIINLNLIGINELESYYGKEYYDENKKFIKKTKEDVNTVIILPIKNDSKKKYKNLQEIFLEFQKGNIHDEESIVNLDGVEYNNAIELPIIYVKNTNQYVILQLKNVHYDTTGKKTNIIFEELDKFICIKNYLGHELNDNEKTQYNIGNGVNYELISIACHAGGANSGHYINLSKQNINNINGQKWIYYNDSGESSYNTSILTDMKKLNSITNDGVVIYYLDLTDIKLLNQDTYSPYFFLYKRINPLLPPPHK